MFLLEFVGFVATKRSEKKYRIQYVYFWHIFYPLTICWSCWLRDLVGPWPKTSKTKQHLLDSAAGIFLTQFTQQKQPKTSAIPRKNGNFSNFCWWVPRSRWVWNLWVCFHVFFVWPASFVLGENCVVDTRKLCKCCRFIWSKQYLPPISSTMNAQVIETRLHDRSYSPYHLFPVIEHGNETPACTPS